MGRADWTRRELMAVGAGLLASGATGAAGPVDGRPVPLIHQTDLFRPHMDPDDHFDLACAFALARSGRVQLLGILCDAPPPGHTGDPDLAAVAMLNHLTGLAVPMVVGTRHKPATRRDRMEGLPARETLGVDWLLAQLRQSPQPVVITVVGSCRDVALAARRRPDLFRRKCRAIYLNAGTGTPAPRADDGLEYNVALDPASYASVFDIPCPIYWMPCFERVGPSVPDLFSVAKHGTYFGFAMSRVLDRLSPRMQRYFLSMLNQEPGTQWLRSLESPVSPADLATWGARTRNMWCTAAFAHMAGNGVTTTGSLAPHTTGGLSPVYRFAQARVACDDDGRTRIEPGRSMPPRFVFEITDTAAYTAAMTEALAALLEPLGR